MIRLISIVTNSNTMYDCGQSDHFNIGSNSMSCCWNEPLVMATNNTSQCSVAVSFKRMSPRVAKNCIMEQI